MSGAIGSGSDMGFWGLKVDGGANVKYDIEQTEDQLQYVHLTNVAINPKDAKDGFHTLTVVIGNQECVLATLSKSVMQHSLDLILDSPTIFKNSGGSALYLSGYQTTSSAQDFPDDRDGQEVESDDDDEEAPMAVPIQNGKVKSNKNASKKAAGAAQEPDSDDNMDDSDDDSEDFELDSQDEIIENDEDEDDEGEEDEEDEGESGDEDEEGEEEEESEEEAPVVKPGAKRPAPMTPAVQAKKAKPEIKAPASAPPKVQQQQKQQQQGQKKPEAAGGSQASYEKALKEFLGKQPNKSAKMAQLGSSVKRPADVPKMAAFLKSRTSVFKVDDRAGTVSLL